MQNLHMILLLKYIQSVMRHVKYHGHSMIHQMIKNITKEEALEEPRLPPSKSVYICICSLQKHFSFKNTHNFIYHIIIWWACDVLYDSLCDRCMCDIDTTRLLESGD